MPGMGQTEKNSVRAYVFRFTPELGHCSSQSACPFRAISGREQCDPGQSILVAPIAGRYDEAGDRDRVAIAGARWDL
jgi:hypothetical protein